MMEVFSNLVKNRKFMNRCNKVWLLWQMKGAGPEYPSIRSFSPTDPGVGEIILEMFDNSRPLNYPVVTQPPSSWCYNRHCSNRRMLPELLAGRKTQPSNLHDNNQTQESSTGSYRFFWTKILQESSYLHVSVTARPWMEIREKDGSLSFGRPGLVFGWSSEWMSTAHW